MKESGDVLEIEDDRGKTHTEKLIREWSGHVHNQLDFFSKGGWTLPTDLRAQLKYDPFIAHTTNETCTDIRVLWSGGLGNCQHQCFWSQSGRRLARRLVAHLQRMVLQEWYIGSHEEMLNARQHGFDHDFWAGSPNSPMVTLLPGTRETTLDDVRPKPVATSPIADGVETLSRKTFLTDTRVRRIAEIEHDFNKDKDAWSAAIEGVKWTGVSVFRLAAALEPKVIRTGKGRVTGTGYSKLDALPRDATSVAPTKSGKLVLG